MFCSFFHLFILQQICIKPLLHPKPWLGCLAKTDHQDKDHTLQFQVVEKICKIHTYSQYNIEYGRNHKKGKHWVPRRDRAEEQSMLGDEERSDLNLALQGLSLKGELPVRGRTCAEVEMKKLRWDRNGKSMVYVKGRGRRGGWKVQLNVQPEGELDVTL